MHCTVRHSLLKTDALLLTESDWLSWFGTTVWPVQLITKRFLWPHISTKTDYNTEDTPSAVVSFQSTNLDLSLCSLLCLKRTQWQRGNALVSTNGWGSSENTTANNQTLFTRSKDTEHSLWEPFILSCDYTGCGLVSLKVQLWTLLITETEHSRKSAHMTPFQGALGNSAAAVGSELKGDRRFDPFQSIPVSPLVKYSHPSSTASQLSARPWCTVQHGFCWDMFY